MRQLLLRLGLDKSLSVYDKIMFIILLLFALMSNISTAVTTICLVAGIVIICVQKYKTQKLPVVDKTILKVVSGFCGIWLILSFFSQDFNVSIGAWGAMVYRFSPLFFVLMYVKNKPQFLCLVIAFAVSVIVDDIYAIYQAILMGIRPQGFNNSATFVGTFMLMALPVFTFFALQKKMTIWQTRLFMLGGILSLIVLLLSKTRGAWLSFVIVVCIMGFISKIHRKKILLIIFSLVVFISIAFAAYPEYLMRLLSSTNMEDNSANLRLQFWQASLNMFHDYPILGVGLDMFGPMHDNIYALSEQAATYGNPHNNYFKILTEGGIIGFCSFLWLHGYFLYRMIRNYRLHLRQDDYAVIGILVFVGFHLSGITDNNIHNVLIMREFWFLMGMSFIGSEILLEREMNYERD